jgi:glycosyltransferase domain-containing protein
MALISNLTLVIPSYNRQKYLLRSIEYFNNKSIKIVILDGTNTPIDEKLLKVYSNIQYFHLPISFAERLAFSSKLITTKYVALLGDDDFFLKTGLIKLIEELERNNEIISCMGSCLNFNKKTNNIFYRPYYNEMYNYNILQNIAEERMYYHMSNYTCSSIYAVVRTEYWVKAVEIMGQELFQDPAIPELQFELTISYFGKSMVIPTLTWLRSNENLSISHNNNIEFNSWWNDTSFSNDKNKLINILAKSFYRYNNKNYTYQSLLLIIENSFNLFSTWKENRIKNKTTRYFQFEFKMQNFIFNWVRKVLKKGINFYYFIFFKEKEMYYQSLKSTLKLIKNKNIHYELNELEELEKYIINYKVI